MLTKVLDCLPDVTKGLPIMLGVGQGGGGGGGGTAEGADGGGVRALRGRQGRCKYPPPPSSATL